MGDSHAGYWFMFWSFLSVLMLIFLISLSVFDAWRSRYLRRPNIVRIVDELEADGPDVVPFPDKFAKAMSQVRESVERRPVLFSERMPPDGSTFVFVDPDDTDRWIVGYMDGQFVRTDSEKGPLFWQYYTHELSYWYALPAIPEDAAV